MDRAIVLCFEDLQSTGVAGDSRVIVRVAFTRDNVEGTAVWNVEAVVNWNENLAQVKTRITNAIIAYGAENGFILTASQILMPSYVKG